jgi:hypothetical protein
MARKLIDQEEAARILGVTTEEVGSLRDRKKLFPFRDGGDWKYKPEDLERLKAEMDDERAEKAGGGGGANEEEWTGDSHMSDVELELNDDLDSILLSEVEMGGSAKEGMSTIIGKMSEDAAGDADLPPATASRAVVNPTGDSGISMGNDSGITLSSDSEISLADGGGGSSIPLGMDSDVKLAVSGSDIGTKSPGGSSDKLFGSDALRLSDDELSLVDSGQPPVKSKSGDSGKKGAGSSIKLGDEELEVFVGGSDVTQSPTDSGIQLISASDSGLSLDQPLALGSSARRLLDGGEGEGAEGKGEDDFLLTALDDTGEESSDSGSQVIALDSDDEISSGMFAPLAGGAGLLEEEPMGAAPGAAVVTAASPTMMMAPAPVAMAAPAEAPFTGPTVAILAVCVVFLLLCGMMTFDLMRNMWSWDGPYNVNSSIMESIGGTIGWFDK